MQNAVIVTGITSALAWVGFMAGVGTVEVVQSTAFPEDRAMFLERLEYNNGMFTQEHRLEGGGIIRMAWAAEIVRGNVQLCGGGGYAPYEGGTKVFTPDDWTGDDCPELQTGDIARASWEYTTSRGFTASISGEIEIQE